MRIHFDDMMAEDTDAASDAVKQALIEMHDQCESRLADALESIGARIDPADVFALIRAMKLPFDQVIDEFGAWVHVSHSLRGPQRGNVLMAYRQGGKTHYRALS